MKKLKLTNVSAHFKALRAYGKNVKNAQALAGK
jgi:hypothetical protein